MVASPLQSSPRFRESWVRPLHLMAALAYLHGWNASSCAWLGVLQPMLIERFATATTRASTASQAQPEPQTSQPPSYESLLMDA